MRAALATVALVVAVLAGSACEPAKMPYELPGPPGAGMRDPASSGPSTMSIAQQTTLKKNGQPQRTAPNEHGGLTWYYLRHSGGVFGESETADTFIFNDKGQLVAQKTELVRSVGK